MVIDLNKDDLWESKVKARYSLSNVKQGSFCPAFALEADKLRKEYLDNVSVFDSLVNDKRRQQEELSVNPKLVNSDT